MSDRRYDDDEVREILAMATEVRAASEAALPARVPDRPAGGLTLDQLQEVAAAVGISGERLQEAVAVLDVDRAALPPVKRQLGVDISTAHVVRLPRMLTSEEWDRFVVRLRDTFQARGEVKTEGSLRTWSNGYLQVLLEPLPDGARLRFKSIHGASKQWLDGAVALGVSGGFLATFFGVVSVFGGKPIPGPLFGMAAIFPVLAPAFWAWGRKTAARWLPERRQQFLQLGAEAQAVVTEA